MFPGTNIPSVPAKAQKESDAALSDAEQKRVAEARKPAKRKFMRENAADFIQLCADPITEEQAYDFRTAPLFLVAGRFSHFDENVTPLKDAIARFVQSLPESDVTESSGFARAPDLAP